MPDSPLAAVDAGAPESAQQGPHRPPTDHVPETGWQAEFARLWDEFVPPRGQARTVQGELIRCVGRLTDEAYRNGNQNWSAGSGHDRMLQFIAATLLSDSTFDSERQTALRADLAEISDFEHPNTGGPGTCYYSLTEAVVDWCRQHRTPIAREADPDLKL